VGHIGYEKATAIAREAMASGRTVREVALETGLIPAEDLDKILSAGEMTRPGVPGRRPAGPPGE
jgi:aspartate ammonia-lyase